MFETLKISQGDAIQKSVILPNCLWSDVREYYDMPAKTVDLEKIPYRIFVNRERGLYRGFWFCPHHDCYGAYRCDHVSETAEDAIEIAADAARMHEAEVHGLDQVHDLYPELQVDDTEAAVIKIHG